MESDGAGRGGDEVAGPYGLVCFVTLTALVLAEQSAQLPGAVVACASGWFVVRLGSRVER